MELKKRGMKVSTKTEYLYVNRGNDEETVKMEDTIMPRIKEFMGSIVQESGSCEREVKSAGRMEWMKKSIGSNL